ncbi:MAG: hypothetical protein V4773_20285 [Verrucomicrobiota bacterium]
MSARLPVAFVKAAAFFSLAAALPSARAAEDVFDRLEDALTFSAADSRYRARVSGTVDLEGYAMQLPAPGVIHGASEHLFIPRLSVFLDAQLGRGLYFFAQARVDRGFDPAPNALETRLDEYALRFSPYPDNRITVQVGRFATIVGNWAARHASWPNPFITAPVPYEHLTGIWDTEAVRFSNTLLQWAHVRPGLSPTVTAGEKALRVPIVWGPSYATGASATVEVGRLRLSGEVKASSLSSRPEAWDHIREQRSHPTVSARVGYRPSAMWDVGVSASEGSYLRESAESSLAVGHGRGDYRQRVLAHDVAFAWRHLQVWAEVFAARYEIPLVGDADTVSYYVESKYKFTPQWFGAVRWNQQVFGHITDRGVRREWGHEIWRVDIAPGYRFTPHTQLKFQYSLQRGDAEGREYSRTLATQFTLRF